MAAPSTPTNFYVQQANSQVYLLWDLNTQATSYSVQRSIDGLTYTTIASPTTPYYLDSTVAVNTPYYYQVAGVNINGTGTYTSPLSIVPTYTAQLNLGQLRLLSQWRADRVNSNFVTLPEWNVYINQSYFELYDILVNTYEDWFMANPFVFVTNGNSNQYPTPNGILTDALTGQVARPFYKLLGLDLGLDSNSNAWVTLKKFDFISRNRYVFPQLTSTYLGVFNLRYRLVDKNIFFIPTPSANQYVRMWYVPRMVELLQETDVADGVSGWTEYIIVDAAIKALRKEESDTTELQMEKAALLKRIEESASNRDAGQPDTISNTRSWSERWGAYGPPNGDGGYGGY